MIVNRVGGYCSNLSAPSNQTSDRLQWLDILKGIGIILVALGHVYQNSIFYNFVYAFHMPLFFMAAGWLYKEKPVFRYIKHRFFTVMVPYFSLGFVTLIYWQLIERRFRDSDMSFLKAFIGFIRGEYDLLDFNVHLWFLPCFFLTVVIYNALRSKLGRKWTYIIAGALSAVYIVGVYTGFSLPSLFWGLDRVCQYIGFYAIGNWLSEKKVNDRVEDSRKHLWILSAAGLLLFVFILSLFNLTSGVFWFITGTLGTVAVAVFSMLISKIDFAINNLLSFLGRISLIILCVHGPVYRIVSKIISVVVGMNTDAVRSNFLLAVVIVAITIAVCSVAYMVIDKILPWMIGKPIRKSNSCS